MRFKTYFLELQYRSFIVFCHCFLCFCIFYYFKTKIFTSFLHNFVNFDESETFSAMHLTDIFTVFFKLCAFLSIYFSVPLFFFQCYLFLTPSLYNYENKIIKTYCFFSTILFFFCTFCTYYITIPFCWNYFTSFEIKDFLEFDPRIDSFLDFNIKILCFSQLCFQLFFVSFFLLTKKRPLFYQFPRKILYFFFLLVSTIVTPPDLVSQVILTFFFIFSYESFVFFFIFISKYKTTRVNNGS